MITVVAGTTVTLAAGGHASYQIDSSVPGESRINLNDGDTIALRFYDKGIFTYSLANNPDLKLIITVV
jgi:hypothetical protein